MIQTDPNPQNNTSFVSQPPETLAHIAPPAPPASVPHTFATPPVAPPPSSGFKKPTIILLVVLFIAAVAGGLLAFQNFSQSSDTDITQKDTTLAWRPISVAGTCSGVRVIGSEEEIPYTYTITFVLNKGERSGSVTQTFESKSANNVYKIDADVTWDSFGSEGAAFGDLIRTSDQINWSAVVDRTENGTPKQDRFADMFIIRDETCTLSATPTPTATPVATENPSATEAAALLKPDTAAAASVSPTPTVAPTATASATPRVTATPIPTTPPIGGPNASPSATPTRTPSPSPVALATPTPVSAAVAEDTTETLPKTGISTTVLFSIAGAVSLVLSGIFALSRKRY